MDVVTCEVNSKFQGEKLQKVKKQVETACMRTASPPHIATQNLVLAIVAGEKIQWKSSTLEGCDSPSSPDSIATSQPSKHRSLAEGGFVTIRHSTQKAPKVKYRAAVRNRL
eukprot:1241438-Amphidinium_carterae.1